MDQPALKSWIALTPSEFTGVFPFHFAFDSQFRLLQFGPKFQRVCPKAEIGSSIADLLSLKRPEAPFTWDVVTVQERTLFLLEAKETKIALRGQMLRLSTRDTIMFLGSPWFSEAAEVVRAGLAFDDFAIHDPGMDMLLAMESQRMAVRELKQLAEMLTRERTRLRTGGSRMEALLRNLQAGVIFEDTNRQLVLSNDSFCKMFGLPVGSEALVGLDCRKLAADGSGAFVDPARFLERIESTLAERVSVTGEEWKMVDGRVFERDYVPIFAGGESVGHLWSYRDVTARKKGEAELRAEKEILEATLGSIVDGVVSTDSQGRVQLINPAAERLTGWSSAKALGRPIVEVLPLFDVGGATVNDLLSEVERQGAQVGSVHSLERVYLLPTRSGQTLTIVASALPMRDRSSDAHGGLIVFRDVTAKIEAERMKEDFVHSVSHELRTPLTSIRGFIATMQADPDMPQDIRAEFLTIINSQAQRLGRLVDDILEVSRIEAGSIQYQDQSLALRELAERSLDEIRPQATAKLININISIEPGLKNFWGDAERIQSVFTNLLGNAVKFTPERGSIWFSIGTRDGEFRIEVRDTGMGIPEEHLSQIFRKFYRVPRAGTQIPGTGLGLSIVQSIVEHYHGRIEIESKVNQGSSFRVYFPAGGERGGGGAS